MKRVLLIFHLLACMHLSAQLTVTNAAPYNNPNSLVQNVLVNSGVAVIPAIPAPPNSTQIGYFTASGFGFPIDSGIVMVSGNAIDAMPGGNSNTAIGTTPDVDLQTMLNSITPPGSGPFAINDKAVIEFDFIATGDSVKFNYVFGSYEYQSYTCSIFNDPFGFFLSGNGINGTPGFSVVNIASVPGTSPPAPVAVNSLNQGFPSGGNPAANCIAANPNYATSNLFFVANAGAANVNVTGHSVKLTAKAQVTCGNIYHIKLAVADVSDNSLHSMVFLEAKSFSTPSIQINPQPNFGNTFIDTAMIEGCNPAFIEFRKNGNVNVPMTISWTLGGTAVSGVDYAPLPTSLTIPAGQVADTLWILPIEDFVAEGPETFHLITNNVTTPCYIYPSQEVFIWMRDADPALPDALVVAGDTLDCPGDQAIIRGDYTGGDGVVNWQWSDGNLDSIRTVTVNQTTTFTYQIWDECGTDTLVDSVTIYLRPYVPVTVNPDSAIICPGQTTEISPNYLGGTNPVLFEWYDGNTDNPRSVQPSQSRYYPFTILDGCNVLLEDSAYVFVAPSPSPTFTYVEDPNTPLAVNFYSSSTNATTYAWDFGDGGFSSDPGPSHNYSAPGTYQVTLTVSNAYNCTNSTTLDVVVTQDFYLYIPSAFSPNGDGMNDLFGVNGGGFETFEMRIYNRWGEEVFYTENITNMWDGQHQGEPAQQGVYSYSIFLKLPFDKIYQKQGYLTLFR